MILKCSTCNEVYNLDNFTTEDISKHVCPLCLNRTLTDKINLIPVIANYLGISLYKPFRLKLHNIEVAPEPFSTNRYRFTSTDLEVLAFDNEWCSSTILDKLIKGRYKIEYNSLGDDDINE